MRFETNGQASDSSIPVQYIMQNDEMAKWRIYFKREVIKKLKNG